MTSQRARTVMPARHRRRLALGIARSLATTIVLVALYYLLPLDRLASVPLPVSLVVGLLVLLATTVWQLRLILGSRYPAVRAGEALATTAPLFLLLFASAYVVMAQASPASFNVHTLTRTDALYFTVTTFSTVGFGDIVATSQDAKLLVTFQVILDLLVLGLGIRVFIGTVQMARRTGPDPADGAATPKPRQ